MQIPSHTDQRLPATLQVSSPPAGPEVVAMAMERRPGLTPLTLFLVILAAWVLMQVQLVLILALLSILFATVIERPLQHLERRHIPRGVAILFIYAASIGGLILVAFLVAPAISDQVRAFVAEAPGQLRELERSWSRSRNPFFSGPGDQLLERAIRAIESPPAPPQEAALGLITGVGGGIFGALALLAITFYYLMEKALLRRLVLLEVRPESRARVNRIWDDVEAKVGGWLRGQLTLCLIIGLTATIGYGIMDVRFWPLLGLWAGITEIIPILGPWLGGIPAVIIALTQSWQKALIVTGFIVLLQLLENTVLVPRVMKGAVGLSPLTVFVAILAGTELMGIVGAVLAIPIAALIQVIVTDYLNARRGAYRTSDAPPLPAWRWMRGPLQHVASYPLEVDPAEPVRSNPSPVRAPTQAQAQGEPTMTAPNTTQNSSRTEPGWSSELLTRAATTPSREE